ncbi:AMP-binding protein [Acinetobacter baumannii]|nr:AMP-binding protein [Acinetobacter baumannii]MDC4943983.1 AMP-binding protein [Acinetobacter baumannii]
MSKNAEVVSHYSKNDFNKVFYFDKSGQKKQILFSEIYKIVKLFLKNNDLSSVGRVGVVGQPSLEWIFSVLISIEIGAEIVAIPENFNNEDFENNLKDIHIDLYFIESSFLKLDYLKDKKVIIFDDYSEYLADKYDENLNFSHGEFSFKILAFTSGSTAKAKIKMFRIEDSSTKTFINNFYNLYNMNKNDNWVVCHSFSHIVHLEYVLGAFIFGYNITLVDPLTFLLNAANIKGDILVTVPNVYQKLLDIIIRKLPKEGLRSQIINSLLGSEINEENLNFINSIKHKIYPEITQYLGSFYKVMIIGAAPSSIELKNKLLSLGLSVYEGYGMSETNMISANTPADYKIGSVGKVWPNIEMKLNDESIILVKTTPARTTEYLNVKDESSTFLPDGWISTGDIGEVDENGFIFIKGRTKDVIVNSNGKNINPSYIEQKINNFLNGGISIVFGNNRPFLVCLISPNEKNDELDYLSIKNNIFKMNKDLPIHERILDFIILDEPFTIENNLMTRSNKPRKNLIEEFYKDRIEKLYSKT